MVREMQRLRRQFAASLFPTASPWRTRDTSPGRAPAPMMASRVPSRVETQQSVAAALDLACQPPQESY